MLDVLTRNLVAWLFFSWSVLGFSAETLNVTVDASVPQFTISLPANPTTGFKWVVDKYDTTRFTLLTEAYSANPSARMGSGGQSVFTFAVKATCKYPKATRMTFRYQRPWDEQSARLTQVNITFTNRP